MARSTEGNKQRARAAQRAASREQILAKKPRTAQVLVLLDDDLVLEHDRRVDELVAARKNGHKPEQLKALEKRVAQAEKAIRDATVSIKFRAIGSKAYDELVDAHPPTEEEKREKKETDQPPPVYNSDTFPIALIAASAYEPDLTEEDVAHIYATWNAQETLQLFLAAMDVNSRARRLVDLGKGSG